MSLFVYGWYLCWKIFRGLQSQKEVFHYRLSQRFPDFFQQKIQNNPKLDQYIQLDTLNSLGIFLSKRQNSISHDDMEIIKDSKIWKARDDLNIGVYQNGLDISKVLSIFKQMRLDSSQDESLALDSVFDSYHTACKEMDIVSTFISAAKNWIRKIYRKTDEV
jgi:hypothetical protein